MQGGLSCIAPASVNHLGGVSRTLGQNRRGELRPSVPSGGEGETSSRCLIRCGAGYDRVMKPAFVGLMIGGATALIGVGVAWIVAAARDAREATSRRLLGAQPRNVKEGPACRTCELCGAEVSRERTEHGCPLIEAYVFVRAESIRLNDRGVGQAEGSAGQ